MDLSSCLFIFFSTVALSEDAPSKLLPTESVSLTVLYPAASVIVFLGENSVVAGVIIDPIFDKVLFRINVITVDRDLIDTDDPSAVP